jgi:LPS-assembly lipoprotein
MKKIRLFLPIIFFFIFTSCGYEPIYSKNVSSNKELLSISVKNIKDRSGQILRNSLLNQLNPEKERVIIKYKLTVEISESRANLAYRRDMSATRADLTITANYLLTEIKSGEIIFEQETKSISSFDVVESVYANLIAEKDAREKNLQVISDDIFTNLVIFFKDK